MHLIQFFGGKQWGLLTNIKDNMHWSKNTLNRSYPISCVFGAAHVKYCQRSHAWTNLREFCVKEYRLARGKDSSWRKSSMIRTWASSLIFFLTCRFVGRVPHDSQEELHLLGGLPFRGSQTVSEVRAMLDLVGNGSFVRLAFSLYINYKKNCEPVRIVLALVATIF